jgi:hypothetical protein
MSAAAATAADDQRITDPQDERLHLRESASVASPIQPDGTVLIHVIRPGIGKGRGRRYYSPEMLRENAHKWSGSRMFLNHETDREARERGHLPRKVEHLGGRILESWWDGDVPASDRFEQGAVIAKVRPTKQIREMIEDDPELIETSINALATATRPGRVRGQIVALVEGIRDEPKPALDWIAGEGGAGGKVLLEATDQEEAVLESLNNDEFQEYLEKNRPELLEALRASDSGNDDRPDEEDEVTEITAEVLQEALASDDGKAALATALADPMKEALQEALKDVQPGIDEDSLNNLIESRLAEQADTLRIDARTDADRQIELRDMRDKAHSLVESAKLHPRLKESIKAKFALIDGKTPTDALNLGPETDEEGNVTKPAMDVLIEAVSQEIADARELQADLRPTRVRGQGAGSTRRSTKKDTKLQEGAEENGDGNGDGGSADDDVPHSTGSSLADELLLEAGFQPDALDSVYARA